MVKCKHEKGELIECMGATHTRMVYDGVMEESGNNEMGEITHYEYHCHVCKKWFRAKTSLTAPKWLANHIDNL